MNGTPDAMRYFVTTSSDQLLGLLQHRQIMSNEAADAVVHALVDIAESIQKIYAEAIPEILLAADADIDVLKDRLWELREEFRHIDYHIHDAKLTDL
jgi:hypothetical protein